MIDWLTQETTMQMWEVACVGGSLFVLFVWFLVVASATLCLLWNLLSSAARRLWRKRMARPRRQKLDERMAGVERWIAAHDAREQGGE